MTKTKVSRKPSKKTSRKTSKKTINKRQRGGSPILGRTVKVRALVYKNHEKKPKVMVRVIKGPRPYLKDIFEYYIADSEDFITDAIKGFPRPPYIEKIMTIKYDDPK
jgi:CRISPR/Cas system Type II protein with McrA/HNH and RuvC-like nuclease domain